MSFEAAVAVVEAAHTPADLFGGVDPARTYRRLSRLLHPDVAPAGRGAMATAVFARLAELWTVHREAEQAHRPAPVRRQRPAEDRRPHRPG
jgi:hypothetical protein